MRKLFLMLILAGCAVTASAQLLWKISGNGLEKPSYLFGTHHIAPISVLDSIGAMPQAVAATEQVYGEVDMRQMQQLVQQVAAAMMLPEGQTLQTLLSPREFERTDSVMRLFLGVGLDNPGMLRMKPMALGSTLSVAVAARVIPGYNPQRQLDRSFQVDALKAGKTVGGLEAVGEQMDALMGASLDRQCEQLMCMVDNMSRGEQMAFDLTAAYMAQDLAEIEEIMTAKLGDSCDSTPEEDEKMIYGRNDAWMKKMPAIMLDKPTLFVVGVGHLIGERGLLVQLKKLGYSVEAMK